MVFQSRQGFLTRPKIISRLTTIYSMLAIMVICGASEIVCADDAISTALMHKPGVRPIRANTITITEVRPNKILYHEGEDATVRVQLIHSSPAVGFNRRAWIEPPGTLLARLHLDLDTTGDIASIPFTLLPGEVKSWTFSFNVGSETYGRAIEIQYRDAQGILIDSWQEYFSVAAEYFRVHMHCHHEGINDVYQLNPWTSYLNQVHCFASEPTDYGVQITEVEQYLGSQLPMPIHQAGRRAWMDYMRSMGVNFSFYQSWFFSAQMGYEEMRKHPEYVLYDENGQFLAGPIYFSYPNPMELASPIEVGPNRQVDKTYLDRECRAQGMYWQHNTVNFAPADTVMYGAHCIKDYAREHGFTGIYFDGLLGVLRGFGYDGVLNVPSDRPEDYARLGGRNHRIYSQILKEDNPNFGTWYNWTYNYVEDVISGYGMHSMIGSGTGSKSDVGDENIRGATEWANVMLLYETGTYYQNGPGKFTPEQFLGKLVCHRDWAVQKYQANGIVGYSDGGMKAEQPGPSKWGWPAVNYVGAQFIATQIHMADAFMPSHRPTLQFMTRYSRFLWARDIKAVQNAPEYVQVISPVKLWWPQTIYRRNTDSGYDLIVHLVRIPPTEHFDLTWAEEPLPLEGVQVSARLGSSILQTAYACRPYYFEEPQQVVQTTLQADSDKGTVTVTLPAFRYHTMVVFRVVEQLR